MEDLNAYQLENDGNFKVNFSDNSVIQKDKDVSVFFRNISYHLIDEIKKADIVVGCIAWLTDPQILEALSEKSAVSIIVQKEDFLRPDVGEDQKDWKEKLRGMYKKLKGGLDRYMFDNILSNVSVCAESVIEPVRCVGNYNREKKPAFPRMHNKFLIFARIEEYKIKDFEEIHYRVVPYAVWTGSFNLTKTAEKSLENALLIKNLKVVEAYYKEYGQICAMSEPLNWESDWVEPQWRIGT